MGDDEESATSTWNTCSRTQNQRGATTTLLSMLPSLQVSPSTIPLIAGFSGGVVSTTLLLPLDIVKLRLQVTESSKPWRRFRSFRILGGIVKYEGFRALWQGWTPAVLGSAISWGGYFYFYEGFKRSLVEYKSFQQNKMTIPHKTSAVDVPGYDGSSSAKPTKPMGAGPPAVLTSVDNFVLACTAGAVMVALTNPVWLVKTRMQLQMRKAGELHQIKPYRNMIDAFRTIVREEGVTALYKGSGPALLLTSHGGVQFVVYEYLRKNFPVKRPKREVGKDENVWLRLKQSAGFLTMGAVAKLAATTTTYPLQLIKSRMQQRSDSLELTDDGGLRKVRREYTGLIGTAHKIYTKEGLPGFFRGCVPNVLRVAPGAAVTFVVYEEVTDLLSQSSPI